MHKICKIDTKRNRGSFSHAGVRKRTQLPLRYSECIFGLKYEVIVYMHKNTEYGVSALCQNCLNFQTIQDAECKFSQSDYLSSLF